MLVVITPKELWHHHEAKSLHANDAEHEEDCAVCEFTFSGFVFTDVSFACILTTNYKDFVTLEYQFISAGKLFAHSGLAPPALA